MDCIWIDFERGKERKRKEKEMDVLCFAQTHFHTKVDGNRGKENLVDDFLVKCLKHPNKLWDATAG